MADLRTLTKHLRRKFVRTVGNLEPAPPYRRWVALMRRIHRGRP